MNDVPVIVISSSSPQSGKTTLALNLAMALAYNNYSVRLFAPDNPDVKRFAKFRMQLKENSFSDFPMPEIVEDVTELFEKSEKKYAVVADIPSEKNYVYSNIFALAHTLVTVADKKEDILWNLNNPYLDLVWETKKNLASKGIKCLNWVVVENKTSANNENITNIIAEQSKKFGFRCGPKISYNKSLQNWSKGYTPMDIQSLAYAKMDDVYARHEILKLTDFMWQNK